MLAEMLNARVWPLENTKREGTIVERRQAVFQLAVEIGGEDKGITHGRKGAKKTEHDVKISIEKRTRRVGHSVKG